MLKIVKMAEKGSIFIFLQTPLNILARNYITHLMQVGF
jgi:hypothetical protein